MQRHLVFCGNGHLYFQRTLPSFESSITIPESMSFCLISSAFLKSRRFFATLRCSISASISSAAIRGFSGTNPTFISVGVWAVSTLFAGLAGVLAAPIVGLDPDKFTILIAASFAANEPRLIEVPINRELPDRLNYG